MTRIQAAATIVVTAAAWAAVSFGRDHGGMPGATIHRPDAIGWKDAPPTLPPGAKVAILDGDPAKPGPFVMRMKFPTGYRVMPHTHPKPERVTVLSGTLHIGMGAAYDATKTQPLPAGSFGTWPAGMAHFGWFEGETVIQLHGEGPWTITYLNPADDPRNPRK
jgi:hypothetical protein